MQNEADFKKAFCDSVHKQGGYTFKIAMSTVSGLPDLYCAMPEYIPVLLELKWIKNISNGKFSRKIPYRPLQIEILNNCNKVYEKCDVFIAFGLIGISTEDGDFCTLLKPGVGIITHNEIGCSLPIVKGEDIDIRRLFDGTVSHRVRQD